MKKGREIYPFFYFIYVIFALQLVYKKHLYYNFIGIINLYVYKAIIIL